MEEQPPPVERRKVVEREESIERTPGATSSEPREPRRSFAWLWVLLLVLLIGALAWYALSRGERQELDIPAVEAPEVEAPEVEVPGDEPNIEINVEEGGGGA